MSTSAQETSAKTSACALQVAPTDRGCCIRVEGKGTMRESFAAQALARQTLRGSPETAVVVDLSICSYLDSTFLGTLVGLHREFGRARPPRYVVAAPQEQRAKLLTPMSLDRVLPVLEAPPPLLGPWVKVDPQAYECENDPRQLARHIMTCHRQLAELGGPTQAAFTRIADQIEKELATPEPAPQPQPH